MRSVATFGFEPFGRVCRLWPGQARCRNETPAQLSTLFAGILLAVTVNAQTYPAKPILMIVPLQAGSAGDVMTRIVAQKMSENLAQQIVIDNQAATALLK